MYKNKAFISYRHTERDLIVARLVQRRLERYRIPRGLPAAEGRRRIGRIFRDKTDLGVRSDLTEELRRELDSSEYLIVICSPEAAKSRWVREEIKYFLRSHSAGKILPVLSAGEPEAVFEEMFGAFKGMSREPVACDFRGNLRLAVREELPRITATLIGCGYDELIDRNRRYERQRTAFLLAAAFAVVSFIAALSLFSRSQINKSRREKMMEESRNLASRSAYYLGRKDRFEAIRLVLKALPEQPGDRPVPGEAVLALQKAVGAYITEKRKESAQTGEYIVEGEIDDWGCISRGEKTYLAIQYAGEKRFELALWELESGRKSFDSAGLNRSEAGSSNRAEAGNDGEDVSESSEDPDEEEPASLEDEEDLVSLEDEDFDFLDEEDADSDDLMSAGNFLLSEKAVLWSSGSMLYAIDPENGRVLWSAQDEKADRQIILASGEDLFAMLAWSEDSDFGAETLQMRRFSDGKVLREISVSDMEKDYPDPDSGYMEIPKAFFSENGKTLILEEDLHFYDDAQEDFCRILRLDTETMESSPAVQEPGLLDYCLLEKNRILEVSYEEQTRKDAGNAAEGDDETNLEAVSAGRTRLVLKAVNLRTGKTEWTAVSSGTGDGIPAVSEEKELSAAVLSAGSHVELFDPGDGRALFSVDFPEEAVVVYPGEKNGKKVLCAVSRGGAEMSFNPENGKIALKKAVLPDMITGAVRTGGMTLLRNEPEGEESYPDRIAAFSDGVYDTEMLRIALPWMEPDSDCENLISTAFDDLFILENGDGEVFGLDARTGEFLWKTDAGTDAQRIGGSTAGGHMAFFEEPDETGKESGAVGQWRVLNLRNGEVRSLTPADFTMPEELSDAKVTEVKGSALAGDYLEAILSVREEEAPGADEKAAAGGLRAEANGEAAAGGSREEANGEAAAGGSRADANEKAATGGSSPQPGERTVAVRFSLSDGETVTVELMDAAVQGTELMAVTGNESGMNTLCFFSSSDEGQILAACDWESGNRRTRATECAFDPFFEPVIKWNSKGDCVGLLDCDSRMWTIPADGDTEVPVEENEKKNTIAGFDFRDADLMTVEADQNSVWFCDKANGLILELPSYGGKESDAEALAEFPGETEVSVVESADGKSFVKYGRELFVIDRAEKTVETVVRDLSGYNPATDTFLFSGNGESCLSKRYTWEELAERAREILR